MEKLETYDIGLDELEASMMIAELNRSTTLLTKLRDEKMSDFMEMFGQVEGVRV